MAYKPLLQPPLNLIELDTIDSTNDHAKKMARNAYPSGLVIWAHEQTAGRGRLGNEWISIPGNLFMSMIIRPRMNAVQAGQLSLLTGVAVANVLESFVPAGNNIRLKWPNDIFINGKKAGGILIETESQGQLRMPWAVIGIGLNITGAPENAISLHDVGVDSYEAGHVIEFLSREILHLVKHWEQEGFAPIREAWLHRAYKLGQTITARLPKETVTGVFEGLDETGALLLTSVDGRRQAINTGEVFA
jgi:BirA family biotin operon repressor/biotin-[acetyl-CoA-carboxylase] ligase